MKLSRAHVLALIATPVIAVTGVALTHGSNHADPAKSGQSSYGVSNKALGGLGGLGGLLPPAPDPESTTVVIPPVVDGPATCC